MQILIGMRVATSRHRASRAPPRILELLRLPRLLRAGRKGERTDQESWVNASRAREEGERGERLQVQVELLQGMDAGRSRAAPQDTMEALCTVGPGP